MQRKTIEPTVLIKEKEKYQKGDNCAEWYLKEKKSHENTHKDKG